MRVSASCSLSAPSASRRFNFAGATVTKAARLAKPHPAAYNARNSQISHDDLQGVSMAKLSVKEIQTLAKKFVAENPGGIRYGALVQRISMESPETPKNTIHHSVWDLATRFPSEITKPSRGLFLAATPAGGGVTVTPPVLPPVKTTEEDFYEPFADWLKNELDEATVAIPLGGAGLQKKWGTPDVIGVYKALASHRIKFDLEIISAEI
jgi:hypothetical protein